VRRPALIALLATGLLLVGCDSAVSGDGGDLGSRHGRGKPDRQCGRADADEIQQCMVQIQLYCGYGAVSRAQLDECNKNVTRGQINRLDTNAAQFARSIGSGECLGDAGPFCRGVS
jgi:hypothetical protein